MVTTDGAPAMCGNKIGLARLVRKHCAGFKEQTLTYHCIIHQQNIADAACYDSSCEDFIDFIELKLILHCSIVPPLKDGFRTTISGIR